MNEPFLYTTGRWYNKEREDGGYAKAPAYRQGFTYDGFAYGTDTPADFTPADAPLQHSLICSPAAAFLAIDVDYAHALGSSATGALVSWNDAISVRGSHFHVGVDMRGVPEADWPAQGRTAWGDVKAAGFIPVPGSVHYTGEPYAATANWPNTLVPATPELVKALRADRDEHAIARLSAARAALGGAAGTRLPDGAYLYSSGYTGGTWAELADGALTHDDELKDLVWDMHVTYGLPEDQVREQWQRLAGALGSAWTERDFTRHWHRVPARRAQVLEQDDATRLAEDFGLHVLEPGWQAEVQRQRQAYADAPVAGGAKPAQPPPGWGFEAAGIDYFSLWLGGEAFDAGRPNDADNAMAVLTRSHHVLRYDEEAGTWLLRGTGKWESFTGAAGPRAVINGLRSLMPEGCADPAKHPAYEHLDPDTDAGQIAALKAQAKNRERFSASSMIGSVAAVMADTVLRHRGAGGVVRSRGLDAEREVLWAGGVPWDLRATRYEVRPDGKIVALEVIPAAMDRNTPHLMTAPVVPDPSCKTEKFDAYCRAVFPDLPQDLEGWGDGPQAGREWALDVLAAAFTGYADAIMPVLLGETRLGKTFLVNLLTSVLGDYGGVMSSDLLKADARLHGSFTLKLKGMRLAFVDEAPGKGKASQEHLKKITGGGKMEGNKMRENPIEFFPTHTLVLATNVAPELTDPALRARARMIKFDGDRAVVKAAAAAIGGSVESQAWRDEMPGVLAQMMARAARWLGDRSVADTERAPRAWQTWTDEIVADQDSLTGWLHCGEVAYEAHPGTTADKLHQHYVMWCKSHSVPVELPPIAFGIGLKNAGYVSRKSMGVKWWPLRIVLPGAAEFMGGRDGHQGGSASLPPSTLPQTIPSEKGRSSAVESVVREGRDSTHTNNTHSAHTHAHTQEPRSQISPSLPPLPSLNALDLRKREGGEREGPSLPAADPSSVVVHPVPGTEPAGLNKTLPPETGENGQNAQNDVTPPTPKTPKTPRAKLTEQEKAERAAAKKEAHAQARADARTEKIAELGGPLVQLPAIVLRDQSILPVDAEMARTWLESCLAELSVDVEHSGYPRTHKDYALRLVQLGNEGSAVVLNPADPAQAAVISWALANAVVLHAHSALADLIPLEAAGLCDGSVWDKMRDSVLLAKLVDPSLCDSDEVGLKALAKSLLGAKYALSWKCDELRKAIFAAGGWIGECEVTTPAERSGWANIPVCEGFVRYSASDVMDCSAVWRLLTERGK